MHARSFLKLVLAASAVAGCSLHSERLEHTANLTAVRIETNPPDQRCEFKRGDKLIALIEHTPGEIKYARTEEPLLVDCSKAGYTHYPGLPPIFALGFKGEGIDSVHPPATKDGTWLLKSSLYRVPNCP